MSHSSASTEPIGDTGWTSSIGGGTAPPFSRT
jgi:hypothetical protein